MATEFWLGLEKIHMITNQGVRLNCKLGESVHFISDFLSGLRALNRTDRFRSESSHCPLHRFCYRVWCWRLRHSPTGNLWGWRGWFSLVPHIHEVLYRRQRSGSMVRRKLCSRSHWRLVVSRMRYKVFFVLNETNIGLLILLFFFQQLKRAISERPRTSRIWIQGDVLVRLPGASILFNEV
jgi:hypothetical protein